MIRVEDQILSSDGTMNDFIIENLKFLLQGKKILLGITGSIAAFKACDVIRFLKLCGAQVRVVLSSGAENFVTETTLETLTQQPVLTHFWKEGKGSQGFATHHIETARWADLILIAPATAQFIGKMAHGLADDLLSTELLAFNGPVIIAPAMNPSMYSHPAVQANLQLLQSRGVDLCGPNSGLTSCGEEGLGRMSEPEQIILKISKAFHSHHSKNSVLITLGPTRSAIDPVRFLTNRSSGLMGASLAWAFTQAGYPVELICGPIEVPLPEEAKVTRIQTASEMLEGALQAWTHHTLFISTAAVLDWEFKNPSLQKLKKEENPPLLSLQKAPDILSTLASQKKRDQIVIGFAAETENLLENATRKLKQKNCDALFVNDVSNPTQGFESQNNSGFWILPHSEPLEISNCPKTVLARKLVSLIEHHFLHCG